MDSKSTNSISIVTALVIVYVVITNLSVPFAIVFGFFLLSVAGLLWMVVAILKDTSNLSGKTFDEHFYEDMDENQDSPSQKV
jgi:hypothetical protein